MTVAELIEVLKRLNPEVHVLVHSDAWDDDLQDYGYTRMSVVEVNHPEGIVLK